MKEFSKTHGFTFPYLLDETQETARAYNAVCTPDFSALILTTSSSIEADCECQVKTAMITHVGNFEAMRSIIKTGQGPDDQEASIGCSIKWRRFKA